MDNEKGRSNRPRLAFQYRRLRCTLELERQHPGQIVLQTTSGRWLRAVKGPFTLTTVAKHSYERRRDPYHSSITMMIMCPKKFDEDSHSHSMSLLVEELKPCENGRHHVRSICHIILVLLSERDCREWIEEQPKAIPTKQVEELGEETQWCLT